MNGIAHAHGANENAAQTATKENAAHITADEIPSRLEQGAYSSAVAKNIGDIGAEAHGADKARANQQRHWTQEKEQVSSGRPIRLLIWLVAHIPSPVVNLLIFPVAFFYLIFSKRARAESAAYQKQLIAYTNGTALKRPRVYLHIVSFALSVIEKIEGWSKKIGYNRVIFLDDDVGDLKKRLGEGKGAVLICSHLGNIEVLRSLAEFGKTGVGRYVPVSVIINVTATETFNNLLKTIDSSVSLNVINADAIGAETMMLLVDKIEQGGLVVVAADRTSANTVDRAIEKPFLGKTARFSYGAFLIAALLNAPTYFVFALRKKTIMLSPQYVMYVKKCGVSFEELCPRKKRNEKIIAACEEFVALLERYCIQYPFQWYNFFNFWTEAD